MGQKLLSNLRQGLDEPTLINTIGLNRLQSDPLVAQGAANFSQVTKDHLVGNYDFLVFDGTLPSERGQTAMALQELLMAMTKDPKLTFLFKKDPTLILNEILDLRGIRNAQRFDLTPQRAQELMLMAAGQVNPAMAGGVGIPGGGPQQVGPGGGAPQSGGGNPAGAVNRGNPGTAQVNNGNNHTQAGAGGVNSAVGPGRAG